VTETQYFVAHEFTPEKTDDLRRAIDEALADSGLTPYYADNEVRQGHILTEKIVPKIRSTRFGIYDLSNPDKPNVFLELGAAIGMGKPYLIICERGTKLPSDVLGLDRIEYDSYVDLTRQLRAKITSVVGRRP
jgi:predicted nucleotide-binding protein